MRAFNICAVITFVVGAATAGAQHLGPVEVGDAGGGWPGSFQDWAAATDHVRNLAKRYPLDLTRVVAVGHSAGASAALWIAGRESLPRSSEIRGKPVIAPMLGGSPIQVPEHYAQGNPVSLLPLKVPQVLIASSMLTESDAATFKSKAMAKGDTVEVLTLKDAGHFDMLAPADASWTQIEQRFLHSIAGVSH